MITAGDLERRVTAWVKHPSNNHHWWWGDDPVWNNVEEALPGDGTPASIAGLTMRLVEQRGGEGLGDDYHIVVEVSEDGSDPQLFRVNGYHRSYDGHYLDGDVYEVRPKQVLKTVYEKV